LSSSKGRLVKVGYGQQQAEAEMIQGLLSEHGIPSMLRRAAGWDVPDFLAAGPREVLVVEELVERAREVLEGTPGSS
jgi:Putative prokaryotic signal transducing protein